MKHILNGTEITPENAKDIGFVIDYTGDPDILELTVDSVTLVNEARDYVLNHLFNGNGALEGIPYDIVTESSNGLPGITLNYFIDTSDPGLKLSDKRIEAPIKKRFGQDHFTEKASGTSFELMNRKGVVFPVFDVPYLIIKQNQAEQALTLAVTTYVMGQALADAIKALAATVADIVNASTPNAGAGVTIDVGDVIALVLKAVAQIIYVTAILIALKKMTDQLKEILFPKVRNFKACKVKDLIEKGCEFLGWKLESQLLTNLYGLTYLPVPIIKGKENLLDKIENDLNFAFTKGYPTGQDSTPTLGSLISAVELTFNAKTFVNNGVVKIERRDHDFTNNLQNFTPALAVQADRVDSYQLNTNEVYKREYIHYQVDPTDWHTQNEFEKTDCEYSTEPISVTNSDLVMIKNLKDVSIPFALGSRKNGLNWLEKRVKDVFKLIDTLTSVFGSGTSYASQINARVGVLQVGSQFFSQSKLLWTVAGKQPTNYLDFIGAKTIENNYHDIDFIKNNSFFVREAVDCVITSEEFVNLHETNKAIINGTECQLLRVEFYDYNNISKMTYREPFDWAFNTKKLTINE